jgi:hypothetical protein
VLDLSVTISPDHQIIRSPDLQIVFQLPDYPIYPIFNLAGRASVGRCCFCFSISRLPDFQSRWPCLRASVVGVAFGFQFPDYQISRLPDVFPPVYPKI